MTVEGWNFLNEMSYVNEVRMPLGQSRVSVMLCQNGTDGINLEIVPDFFVLICIHSDLCDRSRLR